MDWTSLVLWCGWFKRCSFSQNLKICLANYRDRPHAARCIGEASLTSFLSKKLADRIHHDGLGLTVGGHAHNAIGPSKWLDRV